MLRRVSISNYVLIDSLDLQLNDGLTIITGETGAGKSILLGAIALLSGGKSDVSMLGDKSSNCVVEGEFSVSSSPALKDVFSSMDLDFEEEIIVRRVISPSGRSRSFLNDQPISTSNLSILSGYLIDIHSQHQHLRLADPAFQLSALDLFADNRQLLEQYSALYAEYQHICTSVEDLKNRILNEQKDKAYREYQLNELNAAGLVEGELEELENEQKELSYAEETKEYLGTSLSVLTAGEVSLVEQLKESVRCLSKVSSRLPQYESLKDRMDSCRIELQDIVSSIEDRIDSVDVSPERLSVVEQRLSLLWSLMKKYSCSSVSELINIRDSLSQGISSGETLQIELDGLLARKDEADSRLDAMAEALHARRVEAAAGFSSSLQASVRNLEMPRSVFMAKVVENNVRKGTGKDSVRFMFSSASEESLEDVSKAASGGELSRLMLCLKSMMARYTSMATMIFDEIDTGVSGSAADKMGNLLDEMGSRMQVIAITHLPQVAAKGSSHLCVRKSFDSEGKAHTDVNILSPEERIGEVARLLSGSVVTDAAIKNAKNLLLGE